ncbi:Phosphate-specific transport system accessory protein PhoU homolog [Methanocaldococcus lauensis]|uniref:Phosphate-specific transport system accessory protein PhoU n=1 Tax=Methanocaldococcus lauensis TaxID=2546128 RepID=A0A8D6PRZ0_9EURY|nr:phosphate signaling complex protein PhoU [Methanocaldococcus lauensis]CAB3287309.1 Phosphate-specific transport system accessory protein PhoU homolog [Methanocaldococcus lauensis]
MVKKFEMILKEIENDLMKMANMCIEQIENSIKAFTEGDRELAKIVRKKDDEIDLMEIEIEDKCIKAIALYQPVSGDLRELITAIKISSKLEKIGDNASKICKLLLKSKIEGSRKNELLIVMKDYLITMLKNAMISFKNRDEDLAREVYEMDKRLDDLYEQLYRSMISKILEDPKNLTLATEIIFAAKYLERSGNIVASIGDRVVYMITGERIKEEELEERIEEKE